MLLCCPVGALTFSLLVFISLGGLVVRDSSHYSRLVCHHLGFGRRARLDHLSGFDDFFLGLYNLFFGWFG